MIHIQKNEVSVYEQPRSKENNPAISQFQIDRSLPYVSCFNETSEINPAPNDTPNKDTHPSMLNQ